MSAPQLTEDFLDWWFAPWQLGGTVAPLAQTASPLARRHGYRAWCDMAGVPADLPPAWDGGWQAAAVSDAALLRRAARLYAALLAARMARPALLATLPLAERRWCMGIATTQPLQALTAPAPSLEAWGLAELAGALQAHFAGLWPRLRLVLGAQAGDEPCTETSSAAAARRLRCWRLCLERATHHDFQEAA
ncbi:hypothetical protein [Pseudoduganella chitinolytica]|uniref:Type III secretion protein n=1 Tax=Pseudoduganella chitinolytica TaxID=34070 RepID=A0ABY8BAS7_9BURK|nr:hypothetical protein [Pseudoduganella chitinolytica]WEF32238.1 hypothetical protein PX653_22900 [Pseudoduganella chitinolytica]